MEPRCPGKELNKSLGTFVCNCSSCGKENEVFADEMNRKHACTACGTALDLSKCKERDKA